MKSMLEIAGASLTLAALAAVSTPVFAGPARVELSLGNGKMFAGHDDDKSSYF